MSINSSGPAKKSEGIAGNRQQLVIANNGPTPEQVLNLIEHQRIGLPGSGGQISTFVCRSIHVGSYIQKTNLDVTISEHGFLFEFPHAQWSVRMNCAVPFHDVVSVHAHSSSSGKFGLVVLTVAPTYALYLRNVLGMDQNACMPKYFCPVEGGPSQKHLIFFLTDKFKRADAALLRNFYAGQLTGMNYETASAFLTAVIPDEIV